MSGDYALIRLVVINKLNETPLAGEEALRCVRPEYDDIVNKSVRGSWQGPERLFALTGGRTSPDDQSNTRLILIGPAISRGRARYTTKDLTATYGRVIAHSPVTISNGDGIFQCTVRKPSRREGKRIRETTIELRGNPNSLSYRMVRPEIVDYLARLFRCQVRCTVIREDTPIFNTEIN